MRAILEEPLPNISLFIFIWDQRCLLKVISMPPLLILMASPLSQVMRRYWRIWTKRTSLFSIAWWLFPNLMIFQFTWNWKWGRAIYGPNTWCLKYFSYNVSHTASIYNFDQLHLGGVWWIYISISSHNSNPSMVYKWSLISSLEIGLGFDFLSCFLFLHLGFKV
jgi:hypothetical protein